MHEDLVKRKMSRGSSTKGKVHFGRILTVSSSRLVHTLGTGIMRQNFFDVVFWNAGTKRVVWMEFVRTHFRIQRWIMKPCRKLDWTNGPNSMVQYARTSPCHLLMRGVAVQVAMTVQEEAVGALSGRSRVTKHNADTTTGCISQGTSVNVEKYCYH